MGNPGNSKTILLKRFTKPVANSGHSNTLHYPLSMSPGSALGQGLGELGQRDRRIP